MKKCKTGGCFNDGVCADGKCQNHSGTRQRREAHDYRVAPRTRAPHLGVEIECIATTREVYSLLTRQKITACQDGSLPGLGCEFKVLLPQGQAVSRVPSIVERLSRIGARVTTSCGLHVHIDARTVSGARRRETVNWLEQTEETWFSRMPPSRRNNQYVQRLPGSNHYTWAHFTPYNTLEIRIHPGTLNRHKMQAWLILCADLGNWMRTGAIYPDTVLAILSPLAAEYWQSRAAANGSLETYTHLFEGE